MRPPVPPVTKPLVTTYKRHTNGFLILTVTYNSTALIFPSYQHSHLFDRLYYFDFDSIYVLMMIHIETHLHHT